MRAALMMAEKTPKAATIKAKLRFLESGAGDIRRSRRAIMGQILAAKVHRIPRPEIERPCPPLIWLGLV